MLFLKTEVTRIDGHFDLGMDAGFGFFKQVKIMTAAMLLRQSDDPARLFVHHDLCFQRMALFFAGIVPPLFFLGLSIGLSVTSTKTIS